MTWLQSLKINTFVRLYTFFKIPLLFLASPKILSFEPAKTILKIPLYFMTKNHLGSMYFGALCMGGEAAVAIQALKTIQDGKVAIDFVFKDFQAQFLKRAEADVHFICEQGDELKKMAIEAANTDERISRKFRSYGICPSISPTEVVAEFEVTLSLKRRRRT